MIILKKVLKKYNMSQVQLAEKLGITKQGIGYKKKNPTAKSVKEISEAIGCEIHELFETSEDYTHIYENSEWLGIRRK